MVSGGGMDGVSDDGGGVVSRGGGMVSGGGMDGVSDDGGGVDSVVDRGHNHGGVVDSVSHVGRGVVDGVVSHVGVGMVTSIGAGSHDGEESSSDESLHFCSIG